ncbi:hypothetical protein ACLMJK_009677 [Lecanora helva]
MSGSTSATQQGTFKWIEAIVEGIPGGREETYSFLTQPEEEGLGIGKNRPELFAKCEDLKLQKMDAVELEADTTKTNADDQIKDIKRKPQQAKAA